MVPGRLGGPWAQQRGSAAPAAAGRWRWDPAWAAWQASAQALVAWTGVGPSLSLLPATQSILMAALLWENLP